MRAVTIWPTLPSAGTTPSSIAVAIPSNVSVATRRARSAGCDQRIASRTMSSRPTSASATWPPIAIAASLRSRGQSAVGTVS